MSNAKHALKTDGYIVIISEDVQSQLSDAPGEVQDEINALIQGFVDGDVDPHDIGSQIVPLEGDLLLCKRCRSSDVGWLDAGEGELIFECHVCDVSYWTTISEFEQYKAENPHMVFRN